jgi:hypothetical protein
MAMLQCEKPGSLSKKKMVKIIKISVSSMIRFPDEIYIIRCVINRGTRNGDAAMQKTWPSY